VADCGHSGGWSSGHAWLRVWRHGVEGGKERSAAADWGMEQRSDGGCSIYRRQLGLGLAVRLLWTAAILRRHGRDVWRSSVGTWYGCRPWHGAGA